MSEQRIDFPRHVNKRWVVGTLVAVVAVCVYGAVDSSLGAARWTGGAFALVGVLLGVLLLVRGGAWLTGTHLHVRNFRTTTIDLSRATRVRLVGNRGGSVLLMASDGGRTAKLSVLSLTDYVKAGLPADALLALADAMAGAKDSAAQGVAKQLRSQAKHVQAGGRVEDSPLAAMASSGVLTMAKGAGLGGTVDKL